MNQWRFLLVFAIAIILSGCGTSVQRSLKISSVDRFDVGKGKTVVILPFADYSYYENIESAFRRNMFVTENIADYLVKDGFSVPIQDDVYLFLAQQNIIHLQPYQKQNSSSLATEIESEWSPRMKQILRSYMYDSQKSSEGDLQASKKDTNGLTGQEIVKIGRNFSADYIVRGRIIQYTDRQNPTWEIHKRGVLPFFFGVNKQLFLGQSSARGYDGLGMNDAKSTHATSGEQLPQAVVQVRLWVQDAYTGSVVWTNRSEVKVSPNSFWSDYQYDNLFETAVEETIASLLDDFVATEFHVTFE